MFGGKCTMIRKRVQVMGGIECLQICGGKVLDHIVWQDKTLIAGSCVDGYLAGIEADQTGQFQHLVIR